MAIKKMPRKKSEIVHNRRAERQNPNYRPDEATDINLPHNVDPIIFQKSLIKKAIDLQKENLPHLYSPGLKFYPWAREFFNSTNRVQLICAANQIGKSTTLQRKVIEWASNKKLWKSLWPMRDPKIFWYFYPSASVCAVEVEKKIVPDLLPRGEMKNHPEYGWDLQYSDGVPHALHFRSGVSIFFHSYAKRAINLQTTTVDLVACDEECPEELVDELMSRIVANTGYYLSVFTATEGQQLWYQAMECIGGPEEKFKKAYKRTISMYDCQLYEDGSEGAWPIARIKAREQMCTSESERLKRVMGRFVKDEGRRYHAFSIETNLTSEQKLDKDEKIYAAVDIGSGGANRSATAIIFLAVNLEYTKGRVFKSYRGENEETTAGDALKKYIEYARGLRITTAVYDHASKEFGMLAARNGVPFSQANKRSESGLEIVNSLFKCSALTIEAECFDNAKLVTELSTVPHDKVAGKRWRDDLSDALKYAVAAVPWDFAKIGVGAVFVEEKEDEATWTMEKQMAYDEKMRRGEMYDSTQSTPEKDYYRQCDEWNDAY